MSGHPTNGPLLGLPKRPSPVHCTGILFAESEQKSSSPFAFFPQARWILRQQQLTQFVLLPLPEYRDISGEHQAAQSHIGGGGGGFFVPMVLPRRKISTITMQR